MFSKKATIIDKIFPVDLMVKISLTFVAFLENRNFAKQSDPGIYISFPFMNSVDYLNLLVLILYSDLI